MSLNFGSPQDISGAFGFSVNFSGAKVFETRSELVKYIEKYTTYKLEQMYLPLVGDFLHLYAEGLPAVPFTPLNNVKTLLLDTADTTKGQHHLIAFLHEVKTEINAAIADYTATVPKMLETDQNYADGVILMSETDDLQYRNQNPGKVFHYTTGPIDEYFSKFVVRSYRRAWRLIELADTHDGQSSENLSIDEFRTFAKILDGETADSITIQNMDGAAASTLTFKSGRTLSLQAQAEHPVPYSMFDTFQFSRARPMQIKNYGSSALIASTAGQDDVLISPLFVDVSAGTETPSVEDFEAVSGSTSLSVLALPEGNTVQPILLYVDDTRTLQASGIFTGDRIIGYGISNPDKSVVTTELNSTTGTLVITGRNAGAVNLTLYCDNPSGSTPVTISVRVSTRS